MSLDCPVVCGIILFSLNMINSWGNLSGDITVRRGGQVLMMCILASHVCASEMEPVKMGIPEGQVYELAMQPMMMGILNGKWSYTF